MKRSISALFLGIILFPVFVFLIPQKGFAQNTSQPTPEQVRAALLTIGTQVFDDQTKFYQNLANANPPNTANGALARILIPIIASAKGVFKDKYTNDNRTEVYAVYALAMQAAAAYITDQQNNLPPQQDPSTEYKYLRNNAFDSVRKAINDSANGAGLPSIGLGPITPVNAATVAQAQGIKDSNAARCKITDFSVIDCIDVFAAYFIKTFLLKFAGVFTWMFGMLFHYSVIVGVLNFSDWAGNATSGGGFYPLWLLTRGIVDIILVIVGIALSILYVINAGDTLKTYVPFILLYAVFVNFSWPISRTMVDYSNILTLSIYEAAVPGNLAKGIGVDLFASGQSAAGVIMNKVGLQTIVSNVTAADTGTKTVLDQINSTPVALLFVAMAFFLAYIFCISAIIFMARTVVLVISIILSPFLLIHKDIPIFGAYAEKGRSLFFKQLAVSVVFMLFFFVTVKVMDVLKTSVGSLKTDAAAATSGAAALSANVGAFFSVFTMLILLYFMIKSVKDMSGTVGEWANKATGFALGAAAGGAGLLARGTLGAGMARLANSRMVDSWQGSAIGRGVKNAADLGARSSWDLRAPLGGLAAKGGVKLGAPVKDYNTSFAEREKAVNEKADSIKDTTAREGYLRSQQQGVLGIRGYVDSKLSGGKLAGFRSDRALIDDNRRVEEYGKKRGATRQNFFGEQNKEVQKRVLERDATEAKKTQERREEVLETEKMKQEVRGGGGLDAATAKELRSIFEEQRKDTSGREASFADLTAELKKGLEKLGSNPPVPPSSPAGEAVVPPTQTPPIAPASGQQNPEERLAA